MIGNSRIPYGSGLVKAYKLRALRLQGLGLVLTAPGIFLGVSFLGLGFRVLYTQLTPDMITESAGISQPQ